MYKAIKIFNAIRSRHIFGIGLIVLAIAITLRPFGTVVVIADSFGITPTIYAVVVAISGTILFLFAAPWWIKYLLTLPFVMYLIGTIQLTQMSPTRPYTVITLYLLLYAMVLYFMTKEE